MKLADGTADVEACMVCGERPATVFRHGPGSARSATCGHWACDEVGNGLALGIVDSSSAAYREVYGEPPKARFFTRRLIGVLAWSWLAGSALAIALTEWVLS